LLVDVDDLAKGIAFYRRVIGLQVGRQFGSSVEMLGASSAVYLLLKPDRTRPSAEADVCAATGDTGRRFTSIWLFLIVAPSSLGRSM
jgi:catechol 2,3-dioxygenase-like lactoylglutathione lyase family enzyme